MTHTFPRRLLVALAVAAVAAVVGFAVPTVSADNALQDPAYMGVSPSDGDGGVLLNEVFPGTPADKSGLKPGDILLAIDGKPTNGVRGLRGVLRGFESGQTAKMTVRRNGEELELTITFGARPAMGQLGADIRGADDPEEGKAVENWEQLDFRRLPLPATGAEEKMAEDALGPLMQKAGTRVKWLTDLHQAQVVAHATGAPILWYFPKAPTTPTADPSDYDFYMRSTVFHYETTTDIINRRFVPVMARPSRAQAQSLGIDRFKYYEPGFVIVDMELARLHVFDRIMTMDEDFFVHTLLKILEDAGRKDVDSLMLRRVRKTAESLPSTGSALMLARQLVRDGRAAEALAVSLPEGETLTDDQTAQWLATRIRAALTLRNLELATKFAQQLHPVDMVGARLAQAQIALRKGRWADAKKAAVEAAIDLATPEQHAEALDLIAETSWRLKDEAGAVSAWTHIVEHHPDSAFGWRAAVALGGQAPLCFNIEHRGPLPAGTFDSDGAPASSGRPRTVEEADTICRTISALLLDYQRSTGEWTDTQYDFMGVEHRRNTITAISSLCAWGLRAQHHAESTTGGEPNPLMTKSLEKADAFLMDHRNLSKTHIEKVYAYLYALLYHSRTVNTRPEKERPAIRKEIQKLAEKLAFVANDGQWGHEYTNPFVTGMAMLALDAARTAGATIDEEVMKKGAAALTRSRGPQGSFPYDFGRGPSRGGPEAAAGRMPICEAALLVAGESNQQRLAQSLFAFFKYKQHLENTRQYDYHADRFGNGGFFFFHDMLGAALAIEFLADAESRTVAAHKLRAMMVSYPEIDGAFMDSPNIGRSYGTGTSLVTLRIIEDIIASNPDVKPESDPTPETNPNGEDEGEDF